MATESQNLWSSGNAHAVRVTPKVCEFEMLIESLGLAGQESNWSKHPEVVAFCRAKALYRFVPEWLLNDLHIVVDEDRIEIAA